MTSQLSTTTEKLIYAGGPFGIIGGTAVAIAYVLHPPTSDPETVASTFWIVIHVLFMISLVGGIYHLLALLGQYLSRGGYIRGALWCAIAVFSLMMIFALDYAEVFIFPVLATEYPEVVAKYGDGVAMPSISFVFPISGVLFLLGYTLFSYELYKTDTVEKKSALTLLGAVVVFAAGLSGFLPFVVVKIGAVLFGIGIAWTGISLMQRVKQAELELS